MVGLAQSNQQPSRDLKISETLDPPGGSHHHSLVGSQNSITWAPGEGNASLPFHVRHMHRCQRLQATRLLCTCVTGGRVI